MRGGLCQCGCGEQTRIAPRNDPQKGWIKGHALRFVRGHHNRLPRPYQRRDRRWHSENRGYATACLVWDGYTNPQGYGVTGDGTKRRLAHLVLWEQENGPVPDGLELDHLCRVRCCVRLDHLEPVTHAVNMRRSANTKLTDGEVVWIRQTGLPTAEVAARLGLSSGYVHQIRRRAARVDAEAAVRSAA
jgi:DNA-binding CsgD family transcriptional regulator